MKRMKILIIHAESIKSDINGVRYAFGWRDSKREEEWTRKKRRERERERRRRRWRWRRGIRSKKMGWEEECKVKSWKREDKNEGKIQCPEKD